MLKQILKCPESYEVSQFKTERIKKQEIPLGIYQQSKILCVKSKMLAVLHNLPPKV